MKTCVTCKERKDDSDFHQNPQSPDKKQSNCKPCTANYAKRYRERNADRLKDYKKNKYSKLSQEQKRELKYLSRYGITIKQYEEMLGRQNGVCAICLNGPVGKKTRLCVDHCHQTGNVRGLLCNSCNVGLGKFKDNPEMLVSAIIYLDGMAK